VVPSRGRFVVSGRDADEGLVTQPKGRSAGRLSILNPGDVGAPRRGSMNEDDRLLLRRPGRLLRLAALVVVLFAAFAGVLAVQGYGAQTDRAIQEAALRARGAAADVDRFVQSRWATLYPLARLAAFRGGNLELIRGYLDDLDPVAMGLDGGIGYVDPKGWQLARTGGYRGPAIDFSDRAHIRRALATGAPSVSSGFVGTLNASPLVAFAVPIMGDDGSVRGLVAGGMRLDGAHIGSDSLRHAGGTSVVIIDASGQLIAGEDPIRALASANPAFPAAAMRTTGEGVATSVTGPNGAPDRLIGFASAPAAGWLVLVDTPASDAFGGARADFGVQVSVIAIATAVTIVLLLWAGRRLDEAAEAERRTLAKLREAIGTLEQRQALHDAFVGVMSHELRTPVTTIYGVVKLLAKQPRRPDLEDLLGDVEEEADRLQRITEDLLVLSRAEHGVVDVRPEPVLLQRLAGSVTGDIARRFPGTEVRASIPVGLPPLSADPGALRQVLDNLLANAAKYAPGSEIQLRASETGDRRVRIEVSDEGPGLPDGEHDRIFELFYRSPVNERTASGTGIGLFVVRQLVEAMGGTVAAEPVEPSGLRFSIVLPAYATQPTADDEAVRRQHVGTSRAGAGVV
jgi:signal transduction histidine kinase